MSQPVNPYLSFVQNIDPDNTLDDGRSYVGRASHHLDKPSGPKSHVFNRTPSTGPPTLKPPPENYASQKTLLKRNEKPASSQYSYPTSQSASQSVSQPVSQTVSQSTSQPASPGSKGYQRQKYKERDMQMSNSRWSGRSLMTANAMPEEFFRTAKPVTSPSVASPAPNNNQRSNTQTQLSQAPLDRPLAPGFSSRMPAHIPGHPSASSSQNQTQVQNQGGIVGRPKQENGGNLRTVQQAANNGPDRAILMNRRQSMEQSTPPSVYQQTQDQGLRASRWSAARQGTEEPSIASMPSFNSERDELRTVMSSFPTEFVAEGPRMEPNETGEGPEMEIDTRSDDASGASMSSFTTANDHVSGHRPREFAYNSGPGSGPIPAMTPVAQDHGNPLFMQYPIGDGCHVVVAMYVEKDAQTALRRFPNIPRVRQSTGHRVKTIDQVVEIFRENLEDEKADATG
ncbi:hypothetical protein BC939DRAFT_499845 [Gamsiella multidivaricata]|uniref:uncharacterized protein n=1 Tax=Gamsiella multidivaricata TaxID=101098 RepID=UPI00221EF31C|nr:uncharacterized protein BC939DRAFT_499845 [Gamsiella multidivaricata]KAG0363115.1 hypothetical protein BGZ54_008314 [Gamsiella multidivaricata]KAI7829718.1 hypothetical protein BC939DRAFT_499845 [Gamsiella multidivaricata]